MPVLLIYIFHLTRLSLMPTICTDTIANGAAFQALNQFERDEGNRPVNHDLAKVT